jgi:hypothetical protein
MKRKLLYAAGVILIAMSFNSCEGLTCKVCSQNIYNTASGDLVSAGTEAEYCDAELIKIENTPPVSLLGVTTKWVCK